MENNKKKKVTSDDTTSSSGGMGKGERTEPIMSAEMLAAAFKDAIKADVKKGVFTEKQGAKMIAELEAAERELGVKNDKLQQH